MHFKERSRKVESKENKKAFKKKRIRATFNLTKVIQTSRTGIAA